MTNKIIYFICTGNSCRSQMAEGWAKEILDKDWDVYSAGIVAHGVNPRAITTMQEVNIDISNQTSDIINPEIVQKATLLVTLCSDAETNCPTIPSNVAKAHWGFDDPAGKSHSEFQRVRDEIKERIEKFKNTGK